MIYDEKNGLMGVPVFFLLLTLSQVNLLDSPAGNEAMAPFLSVHGSDLYLSWIEDDQLFLARHDGASWSAPRPVKGPKRLLANWADVPEHLAVDGWLVIAWPEMIGAHGYGLRVARSRDGGETWQDPEWLHGDRSGEEYGFVSLAATDTGAIAAVWLDGRDMRGHGMQLRTRTIGPETLGPEVILDDRTCECCATDMIWNEEGLLAVYRDRDQKEIRDIYAATDKAITSVAEDGWMMPGCPVNGPAIDQNGSLTALAWFTGAGDQRLAVSVRTGHGFTKPFRFGPSSRGRVDCAVTGPDRFAVSWLDVVDGKQVVMLGRFRVSEHGIQAEDSFTRIGKTPDGRPAGFPKLVRRNDHLVLVHQGADGGLTLSRQPL